MTPARLLKRTTLTAALAAAGVSGYLGFVSWQLHGLPWGCGPASGCEDVLKSRWSSVGGVPVGAFACAAYLALAACVWWMCRRCATSARIAVLLSTAIVVSAIWFTGLQAFVLRAFCPWCLADHALGLAAAAGAILLARQALRGAEVAATSDGDRVNDPFSELPVLPVPEVARGIGWTPAGTGTLLAGGLIAMQIIRPATVQVARIETGPSAISSSANLLALDLKKGRVEISRNDVPRIGPASAPRQLILLFDYCCPHCRAAHGVIRKAQPAAGEEWSVLFLPTPLNRDCNPQIEETEDRFRDACRLATLSLAVWRLKPERWAEFDAWLFEPERPRSGDETQRRAAELCGDSELDAAMRDPHIVDVITIDVKAYAASGSKVLPILLSPGVAGIAGRTDTDEELRSLLLKEFGFPRR